MKKWWLTEKYNDRELIMIIIKMPNDDNNAITRIIIIITITTL